MLIQANHIPAWIAEPDFTIRNRGSQVCPGAIHLRQVARVDDKRKVLTEQRLNLRFPGVLGWNSLESDSVQIFLIQWFVCIQHESNELRSAGFDSCHGGRCDDEIFRCSVKYMNVRIEQRRPIIGISNDHRSFAVFFVDDDD
ncbi:hypothetical protein WK03_11040 [Burkholderia cepacia]|nr:hypothetical protein WK03_11040 [Burkholderia cepacia]